MNDYVESTIQHAIVNLVTRADVLASGSNLDIPSIMSSIMPLGSYSAKSLVYLCIRSWYTSSPHMLCSDRLTRSSNRSHIDTRNCMQTCHQYILHHWDKPSTHVADFIAYGVPSLCTRCILYLDPETHLRDTQKMQERPISTFSTALNWKVYIYSCCQMLRSYCYRYDNAQNRT